MQHCTSNIVTLCEQIFNPKVCHELAQKHRFIQRSSSIIEGHEFIKALILPSNGLSEDSLEGLCQRLREFNPQVNISASALCQRINKVGAVELMKACMQKLLSICRSKFVKQYTSLGSCLKYFNNIYIQDSTVFELNKHLHKIFKGTKRGGKKGDASCKAQAKIDLIYNLASGTITDAKIHQGKVPDQALVEKILKVLKEGDLVIRDLGYFKLEVFKKIIDIGAYFLTRFPSHIKVYLHHDDEQEIDLSFHLNKHYRKCAIVELDVWVGAERLPVRLVAYKVSKEVLNIRLRKAKKGAKEMGRTLSKAKLNLMSFSIFIANIPLEWIPKENIGTVYRLRWEIELIFKQWKSLLKIDVLEGICPYRVEALIWGRLCTALLVASITATFMNLANKYCETELSPVKLIQYLMRNGKLCEAVRLNIVDKLEKELKRDLKRLLKNKRTRKTMREKVTAFESYYELGVYA